MSIRVDISREDCYTDFRDAGCGSYFLDYEDVEEDDVSSVYFKLNNSKNNNSIRFSDDCVAEISLETISPTTKIVVLLDAEVTIKAKL